MSGYIGAIPTPQATQSRDVYTATSNQTTFTTQGYTPGFVSVYLNGVHLARADFTATNGSDVVLASGATADDVVEIVSFGTFQSADALPLTGGTMTGDLIVPDGDLILGSTAVTATAAEINLIDGGTARGTTAIADGDGVLVNDAGTMRMTNVTTLATYMNTKVGTAAAILPSNWASPNETFTSSATYTKHSSLADDDYIWFYVVSGGGGSGTHSVNANAGYGGGAMLIYGKAGDFDQAVMVIGAGGAGSTNQDRTTGGTSSLTLRANIGARVFSALLDGPHSFNASTVGTYVAGAVADPYKFNLIVPITVGGVTYTTGGFGGGSQLGVENSLFGGGAAGARTSGTTAAAGNSLFGGAAGGSEAAAGSVPGGAGATDHQDSGQGGAGGAGNIRVYHVS